MREIIEETHIDPTMPSAPCDKHGMRSQVLTTRGTYGCCLCHPTRIRRVPTLTPYSGRPAADSDPNAEIPEWML